MTWTGFLGSVLVGGGVPVVIFCAFIARKSFLVLLTLASAFCWLGTLLLIALLFRGFAPLPSSPGPYALLLIVAVLIQEAARCAVWRVHLRIVSALETVASSSAGQGSPSLSLGARDRLLLALTHGVGHAAAHSVFFFLSWAPLALGDGTYYTPACPAVSLFHWLAIVSLAFFLIHTASMVVAFDGNASGDKMRIWGPPVLHMVASLLTLSSFGHNGCIASATLLLLLAAGSCCAGYWVFRETVEGRGLVVHHALPASEGEASQLGEGRAGDDGAGVGDREVHRSTDLLDQIRQMLPSRWRS